MKIIKVLETSQIAHVTSLLNDMTFQDGKKTASGKAREVKKNYEVQQNDANYSELYALCK